MLKEVFERNLFFAHSNLIFIFLLLSTVFDLFDDGCDGNISVDNFAKAIRGCGILISEKEIQKIIAENTDEVVLKD